MNEALDKIIKNGFSITRSVDHDLLRQYTRKVNPAILNKHLWKPFPWDQIRQLHILGCEEYGEVKNMSGGDGLQPGCYLDHDRTWLLVIGAPQGRITEYVSRCTKNLEKLTVRFTTLESLELEHLTGVEALNLSHNELLIQVVGLEQLHALRLLDLFRTSIGPTLNLNGYPSLEILNISYTHISSILLDRPLPQLKDLSASHSAIDDTSFLRYLPGLEGLYLIGTPITDLEPLRHCLNLEALVASTSKLTRFPSLPTHKRLHEIRLLNTPIVNLDHVVFPPNLKRLYLSHTKIRRIPDGIRSLKELYRLDLSHLTLDELPDWLPELGLPFTLNPRRDGIVLQDTTVKGVDMRIFSQPQEVILQWFEERKKAKEANTGKPLNELKVVFLGDGGAGKSYTIARLLADGEQPKSFDGNSTPGIVITDKEYTIGDRNVQIHFWDFGGQEILHSMHRMFLTDRTLYVVVLNVRDGTQDERARYWLHNIKSFAGNAPVLVVLNQMDENPNASINENDLRGISPGMTEVVKLSALRYSREEFNTTFTAALLRQIGRMSETLDFFFPATWTKVKRSLQTMEQNYIHGDQYAVICEECGVKNEGDLRKSLLQWFNDLGVSFCYSKDARLEDYVILRPDWLTNAIYILLFNKLENVRNGIVPLQTIYRVLNDREIRRVLPDVTYTQDEVSYVLNVVRKFRLSFQVDDHKEFIPMLCDRNSLPVAAEYEKDPGTLEFRMEYEYLPNNVLHRLMVELRGHLDTDNVWLTGARFAQTSTGLSAVVKSEGNVLRIFVRSTKPLHKANTYLSFIKDAVDQINRDMGLAAPVNLVIYKADGIAEEFDYDDLINALEDGETTYRSRIRRKRIPIADILNQTGHVADEAREKLIDDILAACMSMQSQKLFWNLPDSEKGDKENTRNDCIRNLLRSSGYIVSDQSRSGVSSSGKRAGELDMDIRLKPNVPWTIYEALNISGTSEMKKWDEHLKKLLDNYNPNGLPFLFLISYLECLKADFLKIAGDYEEHMRWHDPQNYQRLSSSFAVLPREDHPYIRMAKCTYDRGGIPTTVYHICVRLGG